VETGEATAACAEAAIGSPVYIELVVTKQICEFNSVSKLLLEVIFSPN